MTDINKDSVYCAPVLAGRMLPNAVNAMVSEYIRAHANIDGAGSIALLGIRVIHRLETDDIYRSSVVGAPEFVLRVGDSYGIYNLERFAKIVPDLARLKDFLFNYTVALNATPFLAAGETFYFQSHLDLEDIQDFHRYIQFDGFDIACSDYMESQIEEDEDDGVEEVLSLAGNRPAYEKQAFFSIRVADLSSAHEVVDVQKLLAANSSVIQHIFWSGLDRDPEDVRFTFGPYDYHIQPGT